jgi:hypothetical protein
MDILAAIVVFLMGTIFGFVLWPCFEPWSFLTWLHGKTGWQWLGRELDAAQRIREQGGEQ